MMVKITGLIGDFSLKFYLKLLKFHNNRDEIDWASR